MPVKALLFDLDGTLVDSLEDLRDALNVVLAERGLLPLEAAAVRGMIGDGVGKLVERALTARGASLDEHAGVVDRFVDIYQPNAARKTASFPGVPETLASLAAAGLRLAVVTNKPLEASLHILGALGLSRYFDAVVGGDSLRRRKPHPAPLLQALRIIGVRPEEAIMVGDNRHDLTAARAADLPAALVAYGYSREPVDGLGADWVLDSFGQVLAIAAECGAEHAQPRLTKGRARRRLAP